MSEAQVAKLEELLGRIQRNRQEDPRAWSAAAPIAAAAAPAAEAAVRGVKPTPMEKALLRKSEPDEPEVVISVDAEEPEITIDAEPPEEMVPTAPVGTRAAAAPARPSPVQIAAPAASSKPVARVVSRAEPRTFGELLERTLALRPR